MTSMGILAATLTARHIAEPLTLAVAAWISIPFGEVVGNSSNDPDCISILFMASVVLLIHLTQRW